MILLSVVYVAAMVSANLLVWWLGPWVSPINSFLFIGLDLVLRDYAQEKYKKFWFMAALISCGAALTYILNPGAKHIAIASAVSFFAAAAVDWAIYTMCKNRKWLVKSNASNVGGAAVDSVTFPSLAFGSFMPEVVVLQFLAKVSGGAFWSYLLRNKFGGSKND